MKKESQCSFADKDDLEITMNDMDNLLQEMFE